MGIFQQFPYTNFHEMNLDQIIKICKQLVDEWAQYQADWESYRTDMDAAFNDLKNYVNNYFMNLDLDDAISAKLNAMVADGSLERIIEPMFTSLTTRVTALEAAIAAIEELPEGSTSGDAALDNIRIDYNGYTYDTPGNSVRGQAREANEKINTGNSTLVMKPFIKDLINHGTFTYGYFFNNSGELTVNNAGVVSDYIPISPGIRYLIARSIDTTSNPNGVLFDKQNNVVGTVPGNTHSFVAPYNAYSIRLNMIKNANNPAYDTDYNQRLFVNPDLDHEYYVSKEVRDYNILDGVTTFSGLLTRQYNEDKVIASADYKHTDLIPVMPGFSYVINRLIDSANFYTVLIYNESMEFTRGITATNLVADSNVFTIAAGERFIKVNIDLDKITVIPAICKLMDNSISGKVTAYYGDSLTWYNGKAFTWGPHEGEICRNYIHYIEQHYLPITVANAGDSGHNTLQICARISNADNFADIDHLFIMPSSMNDDRMDVPVGVLAYDTTTYDVNTIIGAVQHAIEWVYAQHPGINITIITEPKGWTYRDNKFEMVDQKFVDAYRRVAEFYGIPVIDLWKDCGFNKAQWSLYYADPSDEADNQLYVYHPNNDGWRVLSAYIINQLDRLYAININ